MKIEEFKEAFLKNLEEALNNMGKTLTNSEKMIIEEFVKQAQANNLGFLVEEEK